jgi:hypothetical protein
MAIDTGIGISLTSVETTRQAPLGQTVLKPAGTDGAGEQVWIYVKALAALAAGNVVCRDLSGLAADVGKTYEVQLITAGLPSSLVAGVAQHAIALNSYGWVLRSGQGEVLSDSATDVVTGVGIIPGAAANGTAQTAAGPTNNSFGVALEDLGVGTLATCVVSCIG